MEFKQLEWDYFSPPKKQDISKIHAETSILLPHWFNGAKQIQIQISEGTYIGNDLSYVAKMFAFNRGIELVFPRECFSVLECTELCNIRLEEFASIFYNCR